MDSILAAYHSAIVNMGEMSAASKIGGGNIPGKCPGGNCPSALYGAPNGKVYMYNVQIREHFSQAKKLLSNITECKVLNDTTNQNITAVKRRN